MEISDDPDAELVTQQQRAIEAKKAKKMKASRGGGGGFATK